MEVNDAIKQKITSALKSLEQTYPAGVETVQLTDILVQVVPESGEVFFMNDDDAVLAQCTVEAWAAEKDDNDYSAIVPVLRSCLEQQKEFLETLSILKPYSFVLVDDDKETVTDLYLVDDDTVIVGDELLKGLDEELDEFIDNLMKE
jgi:Zn-dependent M32 family carboxypeptidase